MNCNFIGTLKHRLQHRDDQEKNSEGQAVAEQTEESEPKEHTKRMDQVSRPRETSAAPKA